MRGEATVVTILIAAFMSLLAPLMLLNPAGMLISYPEILDARVAPEKIPPGDPLYITAWVKDPMGIETVFVYIENEAGVDKVRMALSSGSPFDGMFEAKWISHDTLDKKWYNATIIATNTRNLSSYVILPWQDPTQGHAASQVRAGTFSAGNYAFPNNLTAGGTLFVDNSTGGVGIGTSSPNGSLHIQNSITGQNPNSWSNEMVLEDNSSVGMSFFGGENATVNIEFGDATNNKLGSIRYRLSSQASGSNRMEFGTNATTRLVIDDSGNVGIGTTGPNQELDVAGDVNATSYHIKCPSGFTSVVAQGRQLGCIQTAEGGSGTYWVAEDDCFVTYGGRLPTTGEWFIAMNNTALTDETDDYEWIGDIGHYSTSIYCAGCGSGSITTCAIFAPGLNTLAYRCWISR